MQSLKPLAAIMAALLLGLVAATFVTGCQPPPPKRQSTTTDGGPEITIPKDKKEQPKEEEPAEAKPGEEKPAEKATEDKPAEKQADEKTGDKKPSDEKPAEKPAADKPAEVKPAEKPAAEKPTEDKPAEKAPDKSGGAAAPSAKSAAGSTAALANPTIKPGDWNQFGGTSLRNNTPEATGIVTDFDPGKFDRKTGAWDSKSSKNIKWVGNLGSQNYGNPVVASGKIVVGTNNSSGFLKRYPESIDLGVLVCLNEADGKFLWQHSSEKLPAGRVNDWPQLGICSSALIEGDRLWFVTSRGEVRCLDTEGFYDNEDDGRPESQEPAKLFEIPPVDDALIEKIKGYTTELAAGKLPADLGPKFAAAGMPLAGEGIAPKADESAKGPVKKWTLQADVNGAKRDLSITVVQTSSGPRLTAFKIITPADKDEADVVWVFDMMKQLGSSQHNMAACSVTSFGDILFVNTSNGVDESHLVVPAPQAPSFVALDKHTGKVLWTDNSPGRNILHGQYSSPAVAIIGSVPQVIFGGGDGWVYSFRADKGKDGKPELLWKFDINPKDSILELGGRGTRNDIIGTPVVYDNKIYFGTGQDPEHGEGVATLWCIDPTKRGDISEELAVNRADPKKPIPVKRIQAVVKEDGDMAIANPNSGVVWKYTSHDANGNGKIDFDEQFHRSISSVTIKNDLLFVPDMSGLIHCVDAKTGKEYWNYDMLAAIWGSPLIVGDKVYVGDEDGDVVLFNLSKEKHSPLMEVNMGSSVYTTPIVANGVLYISNKDHVFAIAPTSGAETKTGGE